MDLDSAFAVFEVVSDALGFIGKLSFFADGDEGFSEFMSNGGAENEAPGLCSSDIIELLMIKCAAEFVHSNCESLFVGEQGGDISEKDTFLRPIRDIADIVF